MWNVHFNLPVRTSQPRVQPGICSFRMFSEEMDAGVTMVSRTTMGGDCTE